MRVQALIAPVAVAGAMWVSTSAAHAYGLNTNVTFGGTNPGSFNVLIRHVQGTVNQWRIDVKSNGMNATNFPNPTPEHNVFQMDFRFYPVVNPALGSPFLMAGSTGTGSVSNGGVWDGGPFVTGSSGQYFRFTQQPTASRILMDGSNEFTGYLTLSSETFADQVKSANIRLYNGFVADNDNLKNSFTYDVPDAPEGAGLALLLPGLAPIGMVLRKKFSSGTSKPRRNLATA